MAFILGPKTKKWQIKAKFTWHHFLRKINGFIFVLKELKNELMILENQDVN